MHPVLAEMLARSLPVVRKTVQQAWSQSLMSSPSDNTALWLPNLYQATLEACDTPEMLVTLKVGAQRRPVACTSPALNEQLGPLFHEEMFHTAFVKCYKLLDDDPAFKVRSLAHSAKQAGGMS